MKKFVKLAAITTLAMSHAHGLAFAAPSIDSMVFDEGNVSNLVVNGQGFGSFDGRIIAWDDFENHTLGSTVEGLTPRIGKLWTAQYRYDGPAIAIDSGRAVSGTNAVKIDWSSDGGNSIRAFGWGGEGPLNQLYISYHRFMEGDYRSEEKDNHKQFYLFGENNNFPQFMPLIPAGSESWSVYNNSGQPSSRASGEKAYSEIGLNWSNTRNQYHRWEWFIELNQPMDAYNGVVKGWFDGQLSWDINDYRHAYVDGAFKNFRLGHMAVGFTDTAKAWFDNVYTATTPARGEICEASTWNECRRMKRILVPSVPDWKDSQVVFNVDHIDFENIGVAYLYIINSSGEVNKNGFRFLGGASGIVPPNAPDDILVN